MKLLLVLAIAIITGIHFSSCKCHQQLDPKKDITFLSRDEGSNDGWETYFDNVVIDKNRAKQMSLQQYVSIARHYIDTVNADRPVSLLTFYRITSCLTPIDSASDNKDDYAVISIVFSNSIRNYDKTNITVESVTIWRDGEPWKSYQSDMVEKSLFDSLINSTLPLNQFIKHLGS